MNHRVCAVAALMVLNVFMVTMAWTSSFVYAGDYEKSQTVVQTNECGNYWFPLDVLCSNLGSQNQGEENSVTVAAAAAEEEEENGDAEITQNFTPFP